MRKDYEKTKEYNRNYYQQKKDSTEGYFRQTRRNYYEQHKEEFAKRSQSWYASNKNKMKRREKIHQIDFKQLYDAQEGLCAVSGEPLPINIDAIHVDHDHETGLIRGLTCRSHNVGLGMFGDNWELLEKAAAYVFNAKVRYLNEQA